MLIFLEVIIEIKDFIERAGEPIRFIEPTLELSLPLFPTIWGKIDGIPNFKIL